MSKNRQGPPTPDHAEDVPEPQGHVAGVPYDFRAPSVAKLKSRWWNPADGRLLTPKTFGIGWDLNLYWLAHLGRYAKARARR